MSSLLLHSALRRMPIHAFLCVLCCVLCAVTHSAERTQDDENAAPLHAVILQSPLNTVHMATAPLAANSSVIIATIRIPADSPADIGVGACITDAHGNWFQLPHLHALPPGEHHLRFALDDTTPWTSEPDHLRWNHYRRTLATRYGLYFWSTASATTTTTTPTQQRTQPHIEIIALTCLDTSATQTPSTQTTHATDHRITNLSLSATALSTGTRWSLRFTPTHFPHNPYDDTLFAADLLITATNHQHPEQHHTYVFPAFYRQPGTLHDRGDRDEFHSSGSDFFEARFRPQTAGTYRVQLRLRWGASDTRTISLPDLQVTGPDNSPYVRPDRTDPRFLSIGRKTTPTATPATATTLPQTPPTFFWPIGFNLRSVSDTRSAEYALSTVTPQRIVHAYKAYFDRLARAGGNSTEIWLSSWNLALEWNKRWPGQHGLGIYNEHNAERLDQILAYAWSKNIRVALVIHNHGQASTQSDAEWQHSPYNTIHGGMLTSARTLFTHFTARLYQQRLRRYLVGRYADYPSLLCWKLWTEINLTRGSQRGLAAWHKKAFADWHALDNYYQHPCTTHWSGSYIVPDHRILAFDDMDIISLDAYHKNQSLPRLLRNSTLNAQRGLARYRKPIIVSEFGGHWNAAPVAQLQAEHASAAWCALVSGHAGAPHIWWSEWVDQHDYWLPYHSIRNFLVGEDLRSSPQHGAARSVKLNIIKSDDHSTHQHWAYAWARPGRVLGYIADARWTRTGATSPLQQRYSILISKNAKLGIISLEWWNPHDGTVIARTQINHPGGALRLDIPDFRRHIAFKLKRHIPLPTPASTVNPTEL